MTDPHHHHHHHHFAVIPFPFSSHTPSHFYVTKHLATLLANSDVDVHFTFFGTPKSNAALSIPSSGHDNIKPFDITDVVPCAPAAAIDEEVGFFMRAAPQAVRKAVAQAETDTGRKFTCIIGDPFLNFLPDMADEMNIPWVACWVSGLHSLQTHVYTDLIRDKIGDDEQLLSSIPGLSYLRVEDLPHGVISGDLQSPFHEMLRRVGKLLPRAAAVIANTFEELDYDLIADLKSNINPNFLCTGPFNLMISPSNHSISTDDDDDPYQCLPWLDRQPPRSVVYIGFGTITCPTPPEMAAIAAALEEVGVTFLWSLKSISSSLPESFVDKAKHSGMGMFVPWAPQMAVLQHPAVGAHMTHFGWNSVTESISGGVPMIGRPFMADQPVYARMAEAAWGVGMVVHLTKLEVTRALQKMFKSQDKNMIYDKAEKLKNLIKAAVGPTGTSNHNYQLLLRIVCPADES